MGRRHRRAAALPADSWWGAAARAGPAQRRQSGHVYAHRQLQGRPGARQGHSGKADPLSAWSIAFSPFLPWPALYTLAAAALVVSVALVWRGVRGAWLRALSMALLLLGLCDPNLVQENRRPLKDIVAVVVDRSGSQDIGERPRQTDQARDEVEARLKALGDVARGIGNRGDQTIRRAARRARRRAARAGWRRDHDHRRRRARHCPVRGR